MIWNLITIGGGAAGFFGAITHREAGGGPTLILEKTSKLLSKVRISGGGRCNVTHQCLDPKTLSTFYPRGEKALIGPFHRWNARHTIDWFESRGVALKTEADGRMFPTTDSSETVIDCLIREAQRKEIEIRKQCGVRTVRKEGELFILETEEGETLQARNLLLATGGTRSTASATLPEQLGHELIGAVPSLFTFKVKDSRIADIPGVSVNSVALHIEGSKQRATGPLLVTHWGLSGPGILRLSAWGARELEKKNYHFTLNVNWLPDHDVAATIAGLRSTAGKRQLYTRCPFDPIPKRLWHRLLEAAHIPADRIWSQLSKPETNALVAQLSAGAFKVKGQSLNKDEFVTCGGVRLPDIKMKTMESKKCPGLYFAGEVIDIDGITGGFNFQNAWTTGFHAGTAIAAREAEQ